MVGWAWMRTLRHLHAYLPAARPLAAIAFQRAAEQVGVQRGGWEGGEEARGYAALVEESKGRWLQQWLAPGTHSHSPRVTAPIFPRHGSGPGRLEEAVLAPPRLTRPPLLLIIALLRRTASALIADPPTVS